MKSAPSVQTATGSGAAAVTSSFSVARFGRLERTVPVTTSAANPYWPYDPAPPAGIEPGTGVSVDALFLPPGQSDWAKARVQPCFLFQPTVSGPVTPVPSGNLQWRVRFAPDVVGTWRFKVRVRDAAGSRESAEEAFSCTASGARGYVRVSPTDSRYFEYADGTPFVTVGVHDNDTSRWSAYAGGITLNRVWWQGSAGDYAVASLSGQGGMASWQGASLSDIAPAGMMRSAHFSGRAEDATIGPGQTTSHSTVRVLGVGGVPGKTYLWRARVKTVGLVGPKRLTDALWGGSYGVALHAEFINAAGRGVSVNPKLLSGDHDWTWIEGTFVLAGDRGPQPFNDSLFVRAVNTTGGSVYVSEMELREQQADGTWGANLLTLPTVNVHQVYNQVAAARCDAQLEAAALHGMTLKPVLLEKADQIYATMDPAGRLTSYDDNNTYGQGTTPASGDARRWLQRAFVRYACARWGWSPNLHSFEYLNEGDPFNGNHAAGADLFADAVHELSARPLLASASAWSSFPSRLWAETRCDFLDIHSSIVPYGSSRPAPHGFIDDGSLTFVTDSEPGHNTPSSVEIVSASTGSTARLRLTPVPVAPGETYRFSYRFRASGLLRNSGIWQSGPNYFVRFYSGHDPESSQAVGSAPSFEYLKDVNAGLAGEVPWTARTGPDMTVPAGAKWAHIEVELNMAQGRMRIDDLRLFNVTTGKHVPLANPDAAPAYVNDDTALWPVSVWQQYTGGGGTIARAGYKQAPLVLGETGVHFAPRPEYANPYTSPVNGRAYYYDQLDQRAYDDGQGVWLHKMLWASLAPGSFHPVIWWNQPLLEFGLTGIPRSLQAFLAGEPRSNGRYRDAEPVCTGGLRALGQVDAQDGRAHLWIDNPGHTFSRVVRGETAAPLSGEVSIAGLSDGAYTAEWWDTRSGRPVRQETLTASGGRLVLRVSSLASDTAVKVFAAQTAPTPPPPGDTVSPPAAPTSLTAQAVLANAVSLRWKDNATNETSYHAEISTDGSRFTQVGTYGAGTVGAAVSGLKPSTTYYFRVRAGNAAGYSAYSNTLRVKTPRK